MRTLTIATRKSPLALWQANYVGKCIIAVEPACQVKLLPLISSGDRAGPEQWLNQSGKGLFVKELEEALLTKQADLAVHSMKDLPATFPDGLGLAAMCERANPFDALVSHNYISLNDLPSGAKVGTASLRRQAQLLNHRPDLIVHPLRGNVQTRLLKMHENQFDAIILARAGLERLELDALIRQDLLPPVFLPACGQGAIGIECRNDDDYLLSILKKINCPTTFVCVSTERLVNEKLGGNCHAPVAVYCNATSLEQVSLQVRVLSQDGKQCIETQGHSTWNEATELAKQCAEVLLQQGAEKLVKGIKDNENE